MSATATKPLAPPPSPHKPAPYTGPARETVLAMRRQYLSPALFHLYKEPIMLVEGKMQYMWDEKGRQYLDAFGGIVTVSVGHCHPHVTKALQDQVNKITHTTTIYLHPTIGEFGKKLASHFSDGLEVTYFVNSGSEANEIGILMARLHTGNELVIGLRNGYHGGTAAAMALTAHGTWKFPAGPPQNVIHATPGYCYRCPFGLTYPSCDVKCARDLEEKIKYETNQKVAAFIGEPIQGVGGTVVPPKEYFGIVYDIVRKFGGLCIADEVQTGFGRTGKNFWGFENWGVKPDIVSMAKGIGNGIPLAASTTRAEIAAHMKTRIHFNTFGGNPLSMAQGLATLEVMEQDDIQGNADRIGTHLIDRLRDMQTVHPLIGDVRGMGLMLGIELVRDRKTKEPANTETAELLEHARERGLLIGKGGLYGNVIRLKPPMCITKADADFICDVLHEGLGKLEKR